jgi:NAD-dependent SIR2 family protein deacetylase
MKEKSWPSINRPIAAPILSQPRCYATKSQAVYAPRRIDHTPRCDESADNAVGFLDEHAAGRLAITTVTLRPKVTFSGETLPSSAEIAQMHDKAHHACFIANSVKTEVVVEPPRLSRCECGSNQTASLRRSADC